VIYSPALYLGSPGFSHHHGNATSVSFYEIASSIRVVIDPDEEGSKHL
jgi:hypothetical protein